MIEGIHKKKKELDFVFVSYLIVMMPKDVLWRFGTELDDTSQIDVTAHVDVELGTAQNHRLGSWKRSEDLIFFTTTHTIFLFFIKKKKTNKFKEEKKEEQDEIPKYKRVRFKNQFLSYFIQNT